MVKVQYHKLTPELKFQCIEQKFQTILAQSCSRGVCVEKTTHKLARFVYMKFLPHDVEKIILLSQGGQIGNNSKEF